MTYTLERTEFVLPDNWMELEANNLSLEQALLQRDARRMVHLKSKQCSLDELAELEALMKWYGQMPDNARLAQRPVA